ncbi:FAM18B [Backusella circina FSU 941]|nr:FAM18B [Backusella circina FSU 941]
MTVEDLEQNRSNVVKDYFEQSSHPIAAFFFLLFRVGAMATYLLGSFFLDNFTLVFVLCILQLAFDFWTVKNISGRLLVGLRWWNEIQPDGTNKWVFESANPDRKPNDADSRLFWSVLYITPLLWTLFGFTCVLTMKPSWLIIVMAAIALSGANVYGYIQCDRDAKRRNWADHSSFLGSSSLMTTSILGRVVRGGLGRFI